MEEGILKYSKIEAIGFNDLMAEENCRIPQSQRKNKTNWQSLTIILHFLFIFDFVGRTTELKKLQVLHIN